MNTSGKNPSAVSRQPGFVHRVEDILFNTRKTLLVIFALVSVVLGYYALQIRPDASFEKMIPTTHPYIENYLKYEGDMRSSSNALRIIVANKNGEIFDAEYLDTLRKITDEAFYLPGTDRGNMRSLWTPNVSWRETTETGWVSGQMIPQTYDGSEAEVRTVHANVLRSGLIGSLVSNDFKSSIVLVPLLEYDPRTGEKLDYGDFSRQLEEKIRDKYVSDSIDIHIVGFAKVIGDLIEGASAVAKFFGLAWVLTCLLLWFYSRCWRSTSMAIICATMAVVWQLGLLNLLGFGLDPYSILIPFLTFAIGVSHAVQNINTMAAEVHAGCSSLEAAKRSFNLLFVPGSIALLCNVVGFGTLLVIEIGVIRELAINASIGVAVIIFTKMFLLPILMSYAGVSRAAVRHQERKSTAQHRFWRAISQVTEPKVAIGVVAVTAIILSVGLHYSRDLQIGDLHPGAAELRADSRYNLDNAYLINHYSTSTDVFTVMFTTPRDRCGSYEAAVLGQRFGWQMANVPGVNGVESLYNHVKGNIAGANEANLKWYGVLRNQFVVNNAVEWSPSGSRNVDCSMAPISLYLSDQKAETLARVVAAAEEFAKENGTTDMQFLLAGGNAGIQAATNIVVEHSEPVMLTLVYVIVSLLVLLEFRSFKVTASMILPLFIASILCEAIMAKLGMGMKVATLPVIALGVGIGVDYGIYIYSKLEHYLAQGQSLKTAYYNTLRTTGTAVAFTGFTLAIGTFTWIFSEIKFQADMGLLLTFMFLWNMVGAIVVLPAIVSLLMPKLRQGKSQAVIEQSVEVKPHTEQLTPA